MDFKNIASSPWTMALSRNWSFCTVSRRKYPFEGLGNVDISKFLLFTESAHHLFCAGFVIIVFSLSLASLLNMTIFSLLSHFPYSSSSCVNHSLRKISTRFFFFLFLLPSATSSLSSCLRCPLKIRLMEEEGMVVGGSGLSTKIVCAGKERFSKSLSTQESHQLECCISFARIRARLEAAIIFGGVIPSVWILKAAITWLGTVGVKTKLEEKTKLILKYIQSGVKVEVK